mmetsp:Transcript_2635/g.8824  ORF Transcript_2635/g.8824 Transcript_2635/m.8824 type:complete len:225 (+) Transcript_2635:744-1418(+)
MLPELLLAELVVHDGHGIDLRGIRSSVLLHGFTGSIYLLKAFFALTAAHSIKLCILAKLISAHLVVTLNGCVLWARLSLSVRHRRVLMTNLHTRSSSVCKPLRATTTVLAIELCSLTEFLLAQNVDLDQGGRMLACGLRAAPRRHGADMSDLSTLSVDFFIPFLAAAAVNSIELCPWPMLLLAHEIIARCLGSYSFLLRSSSCTADSIRTGLLIIGRIWLGSLS